MNWVVCEAKDECQNPDCVHRKEHIFGMAHVKLGKSGDTITSPCDRGFCHQLEKMVGRKECECISVGDEEDIA